MLLFQIDYLSFFTTYVLKAEPVVEYNELGLCEILYSVSRTYMNEIGAFLYKGKKDARIEEVVQSLPSV